MENEERRSELHAGEMHKRRETMPDGKRYIIYYTFDDKESDSSSNRDSEVKENV